MEYEQLEKGSAIICAAISSQDVGDYSNLLDPHVLLVTHFPYPETGPAVSSISDAVRLQRAAAAPEKRKKAQLKALDERLAEQHRRFESSVTRSTDIAAPPPAAAAAAVDGGAPPAPADAKPKAKAAKTAAAPSSTSTYSREPKGVQYYFESQSKEPASPYGDRVVLTEGPTLVTECFCIILNWLSQGKYIANTRTHLEPRKRVLQDNEVLPPVAEPTTEAGRYALLGNQYTDRNQRLSCLTLTYGRESLLFRDECYFEEGLIVTIHRRMVPLEEMLTHLPPSLLALAPPQRLEKLKRSVLDFYDGTAKTRINAVNHTWPLLDYSFKQVQDPLDLLKLEPEGGKKHVPRPVRPEEDPRFAQGIFLSQANDPNAQNTSEVSRTMIKAKNKKGEEEAYEFDKGDMDRFAFMRAGPNDGDKGKKDTPFADIVAAAKTTTQYDATSVRIASCHVGERIGRLVPVLHRLVANAYLTIQALDLSDNEIVTLPPDLSALPLQKLQLHGNRIADWSEVERHVSCLPYLSMVTLHGNPIAENSEQYWPRLLAMLMRHPDRKVQLKMVDFVKLTAQDYNVAGAQNMFATGDATLLNNARTLNMSKTAKSSTAAGTVKKK